MIFDRIYEIKNRRLSFGMYKIMNSTNIYEYIYKKIKKRFTFILSLKLTEPNTKNKFISSETLTNCFLMCRNLFETLEYFIKNLAVSKHNPRIRYFDSTQHIMRCFLLG